MPGDIYLSKRTYAENGSLDPCDSKPKQIKYNWKVSQKEIKE
jgi:hypothetical protein